MKQKKQSPQSSLASKKNKINHRNRKSPIKLSSMALDTNRKYELYEAAVQTPEQHADMFALIYADIRGHSARILREDFCGTFAISTCWVKRHPENEAFSLDLDPEPLSYGRKNHLRKLPRVDQKRLHPFEKDVLSPVSFKADITIACNFSYFLFKKRTELKKYFVTALRGLKKNGLFILELAGGPGMIEKTTEQKTDTHPKHGKFTYYWHQKNYNPITHEGMYAIHFKTKDGRMYKDVFTYDWRVWTIQELRDLLSEAGFSNTAVYWQTDRAASPKAAKNASDHSAPMVHEYQRTEKGENYYSYIAYVVGVK